MNYIYGLLLFVCRHHHRHHNRHRNNEREIFIPKDDLQIDENLDEFIQDDLTSKNILKLFLMINSLKHYHII